jgi:dipeptidase E
MKYYLSSYRVGEHGRKLAEYVGSHQLALIPNALDHIPENEQAAAIQRNLNDLQEVGVRAELLDLRDFFVTPERLREHLLRFAGVWITGGNTFVLRQAMRLSGFDQVIHEMKDTPFLYAGYSAGICVLAPDLRGIQIVDDPGQLPYPEIKEPIWEGLKLLDYIILPHFRSNHPESAAIERDVQRCRIERIPFRTLSDGEVLYGENLEAIRRSIELTP